MNNGSRNDRRQFLTRSLAATAAALSTVPGAGAQPGQATPPAQDEDLAAAMTRRLTLEFDDAAVAAVEAACLLDVGFHWTPPLRPAATLGAIVAYSFGNRPSLPGQANPQPGPVNEALADAVVQMRRLAPRTQFPIFAQWEIAHFLTAKHGLIDVIAIDPVVASDGTVTYLSTDGVAEAVVAHAARSASSQQPAPGSGSSLGPVAVIAHRDHAKRCVLTSRARGMDAWVAKELTLPVTYDPESGQPWTRRRDLYLLHDMAAQMMQLRAQRIAQQYPNG